MVAVEPVDRCGNVGLGVYPMDKGLVLASIEADKVIELLIPSKKIHSVRLEVNVVQHCNLSCRGCSHLSPVLPRAFMAVDQIEKDLRVIFECYQTDTLRILGGEPLLHPQLVDILRCVSELGVARVVEVVTNGTLLASMQDDFWKLTDSVAVAQYPGHEMDGKSKTDCERKAQRYGTRLLFRRVPSFRQSYSEVGAQRPELIQTIFDHCEIVHWLQCHTLHNGVFFKCPQACFLPVLLSSLDPVSDGLPIHECSDLHGDLTRYLASQRPLNACGHCLGSAGRWFDHQTVSRNAWREHHRVASEELVDPTYFQNERATLRTMVGQRAFAGAPSVIKHMNK